ncbi:hypothetical protein DMC30DRAFT_100603 [Rhodotorula diobovata]|uniref:Uncharacterized protein n=1 Tax=Rhodotorula diobovata TaxID=5288 RepID=A0A5C5G3D9_9BASI|nr:hypothetical protein DMC30DRAFT_100603 [Rhodotorula diobovata]
MAWTTSRLRSSWRARTARTAARRSLRQLSATCACVSAGCARKSASSSAATCPRTCRTCTKLPPHASAPSPTTTSVKTELEEDDERARAENERLCWTTKSRRGRLGSKKDLADAGNVQRFVDAQQAVFAEEQAQMNAARKVKQALIEQRTAEKAEIERKKRDEFEAALVEHHGWTEEQVNAHSRRFGWRHQPPAQCPRAQPHVKPDAWRAYRDALQVVLDNDAAERRAAPGRALRIHFFRDKFNLIDGTDPRFKGIFPSFDRFRKLDPIKALWYPEDAQLDGSTWPTQEPLVLQVLEELADSTRVNAIRAILAANSGEALSTLSTDPADYPDDEYDDAFFQQITSHFVVGRWTLVPRGRRLRRTIVNTPTAFPTVLGHMWGTWYSNHGADPFASKLTPRYVSALRLILDAAELDEDATPSTLDNLGPTFSVARQGKTIATGKTWMQTVELLRKVGGTDKELGAGIDVSVTHEDAKGKEKGAVSDLEGEGEGESEDGADGSE